MWTKYVHMKTATVRDLRNNFAQLEAWLADGEEIRIEKRGKPVALLTALSARHRGHMAKPDFAGRLRHLWGDRVFSADEVAAMRTAELDDGLGSHLNC